MPVCGGSLRGSDNKKSLIASFVFLCLLLMILPACDRSGTLGSHSLSSDTQLSDEARAQVNRLLHEAEQCLAQDRKPDEAMDFYRQVLRIDPENIEAREGIIRVFAIHEEWEQVFKHSNELLEVQPDNVNGLLYRASAYRATGDLEACLSDRIKANRADPLSVHTTVELARAFSEVGKYDQSLETLRRAEALNPTPEEKSKILLVSTYSLFHTNPPMAEKTAKMVVEQGFFKPHGYLRLMEIYMDTDQTEKAWREYKNYLKIDPQLKQVDDIGPEMRGNLNNILGAIHRDRREFDVADKYYRTARECNPENTGFILSHVSFLAEIGREEQARAEALIWQEANPKPPETSEQMADYAVMYSLLNNREKALNLINTAIKKTPDNHLLLATRGLVHYYLGDPLSFRNDLNLFRKKASPDELEAISGFEDIFLSGKN